jgi:hypothetical protein
MGERTMTYEDLDTLAARLQVSAATIASNLAAIEADPHRALLDDAPLVGATALRWSEARAALDTLWDSYTRLASVLEASTEIRQRRIRLAPAETEQLETLLRGASIEFPAIELPLGAGGLLGERLTSTRCTPDELLASMATSYDDIVTVLRAVGEAWTVGVASVTRGREKVAALHGDDAGDHDERLIELAAELDDVAELLFTDPISCPPGDLDRLATEIDAYGTRLAALNELRRSWADRLALADRGLDDVHDQWAAAELVGEDARAKITGVELTTPVDPRDTLRSALDSIIVLAEKRRWVELQEALGQWHEVLAGSQAELAAYEESASACLRTRDELRGRLDAYHAMAAYHHRLENPDAAAVYEQARDVLYRAPCDLVVAAELVRQYQSLAAPSREPTRHDASSRDASRRDASSRDASRADGSRSDT